MKLTRLVVIRGAAFALLLASPAALASTYLSTLDPKPEGTINLAFLVMIIGFFAGGVLAGSEATHDRAKHGAAAGALAFVPVQLIGLLGRSERGDPISLFSIIFLGFLAAAAGTLGAFIGARRSSRRPE